MKEGITSFEVLFGRTDIPSGNTNFLILLLPVL
jgi:hypothetical protein